MTPADLRAESFAQYPTEARSFAIANLNILQRMPLSLLPVMLRQVIQYDWSFPAERDQLSRQFDLLSHMGKDSFDRLMSPFAVIQLSPQLAAMDWVNHPQTFSEDMTAYLWSQHQIDSFHQAAQQYQQHMQQALEQKAPVNPRLVVVVIGQGVERAERPVFRKLMPHGTLFTQVDPANGLNVLLEEIRSRASQDPLAYGHWYIDGGEPQPASADATGLTVMSYSRLAPVAKRELSLLKEFTATQSNNGKAAVEAVTSYVAGLSPRDLGLSGTAADELLRHFEVSVLTQGAGCQIYSTTFVQWAARECLHRAQPVTLLARFGTRQRSAPMEQLLARDPLQQPQDKEGSLVDADMGAYYTWINQSRLPGADQTRFLAWFENHSVACAISPSLPRGNTSTSPASLSQILKWMA